MKAEQASSFQPDKDGRATPPIKDSILFLTVEGGISVEPPHGDGPIAGESETFKGERLEVSGGNQSIARPSRN
jgi:hypothetical protein